MVRVGVSASGGGGGQISVQDAVVQASFFSMCVRYNDVLQRCKELDSWTQDLSLPSVVWLSGLFNPQSFLTGNIHLCR